MHSAFCSESIVRPSSTAGTRKSRSRQPARPQFPSMFSSFWRVVRLEVAHDLLHCFLGNDSAVCFLHFCHFGGPGIRGERRLHRDVVGTVANVAVEIYLPAAVTRCKHGTISGVWPHVIGCVGRPGLRERLRNLPGGARLIVASLVLCVY